MRPTALVPPASRTVGSDVMPAAQLRTRRPGGVRPAGNPFGQLEFAYRAVAEVRGVEDHAVRRVGIHVGGQRDQVAVVLSGRVRPRRYRRFAAVDAVSELVVLLAAGAQVVLDQAVEQEPARLAGSGVGVAV